MKHVHGGIFTTSQMSIDETITEVSDEIMIAQNTIGNIKNVSDDIKKELKFAMERLDDAENHYLTHVRKKVKKALEFIPEDIQQKEFL